MTNLLRKLLLAYLSMHKADTPMVQTIKSGVHMMTQPARSNDKELEISRVMADSTKLIEFVINYQDYVLEFGLMPNPYSKSLCSYPAPYIDTSIHHIYQAPQTPADLCLSLTSMDFKEGKLGAINKSDIRGLSIEAATVSEIEIEKFLDGLSKLEVIRITDCGIPCLNYKSLLMLCHNRIKEIYIESPLKEDVLILYSNLVQSVVIQLPVVQHPNIIRLNDQNIFLKAGFKPLQDASIIPWQQIMDLDIKTSNGFVMH